MFFVFFVFFFLARKETDIPLQLKVNGKRLYRKNLVKYPDMKIDENLNWEQQISDLAITLHCGNCMSNHPGHDTLTSQILFIFPLFVDSVEMIDP